MDIVILLSLSSSSIYFTFAFDFLTLTLQIISTYAAITISTFTRGHPIDLSGIYL